MLNILSKITLYWVMLVLVTCLNAIGGSGPGQQSEESGIEILAKKVAAMGKLAFKQDVPVRYMDENELKNYIAAQFETEYPTVLSEKENELIRLMGFVDQNVEKIDVRSIRKRILLDSAAGLYNEKSNELLALTRYREVDFMNAMILAHELRHALQDQHFNIAALLDTYNYSDFDDRRLAILAAIEGDATFLMVQLSDLDADILISTPTADALMSFLPIARPSLLYREPEVIKYQLMMPYIHGLGFVSAVFKKKKWKGINQILQHPPMSTEQILHPEKYFKREAPLEVLIQYQPRGYQLVHSGVIGEYYLNILLKPEGEYTYKDYARGWGGDTFHIYKNVNAYFLVWESLWDNEDYCSHFYSDFKRFIERRFNVNFKKGNMKGIHFIAGQSAPGEDYFFLMKLKNKIFYARSDKRDQMNALIYGGNYD